MSTGSLNWSVVVTTAPRRYPKLTTTVDSLRSAGWESPVIFAEPDSPTCDADTVTNATKLGVYGNWIKACRHGLDSGADVIMTVQDDVLFHPDSKSFAESALWLDNSAFLSLYTPAHHSIISGNKKPWGIYPIHTKSLWGAMAMIWQPSILNELINSELCKNWIGNIKRLKRSERIKKRRHPETIKNIDTLIGFFANQTGRKMYYVNPSFAQHISEDSSIGGRPAIGKRAARFVVGCNGCPEASDIPVNGKILS